MGEGISSHLSRRRATGVAPSRRTRGTVGVRVRVRVRVRVKGQPVTLTLALALVLALALALALALTRSLTLALTRPSARIAALAVAFLPVVGQLGLAACASAQDNKASMLAAAATSVGLAILIGTALLWVG